MAEKTRQRYGAIVDPELVARFARGEPAARSELLGLMQDHWFRFCLCQLHNDDAAADAVQETALRVLKDIDRFDHRAKFETWSFGIALNVCRESRRHRRTTGLDEQYDAEADHRPAGAEEREELASLLNALSELTERQREAVSLRYLQRQSVEATAKTMGCAIGTAKATLHQALAALRGLMGERQ